MTFNCENKRFHLLRAGVSAAKVHTHPGNSPVPFHLFFEFTKIHVYIIEPLKVLFFFFNNPFPLVKINHGGDHHSPKRKREKKEKYAFRSLATYSF